MTRFSKDCHKISILKTGNFVIPIFPISYSLQDSPRLRKSIKGMKTLLSNQGYKKIANYIKNVDDGTLPNQMESLHQTILAKIAGYNHKSDDQSLEEIFHLIQYWGGRTGRSIYVRGTGFSENFSLNAYKKITLESSCFNIDTNASLKRIISSVHDIHGLGISFVTKHMRFWAEASNLGLPIYDKLMAQICFGFDSPQWSHYLEYYIKMHEAAQKMEVTVNELERRLFCFADSEDGGKWIKVRTVK